MPRREDIKHFSKDSFMKQLRLPEVRMSSFVGFFITLCGVERPQRREIESIHQIKMKCILLTLQNNQGISTGV